MSRAKMVTIKKDKVKKKLDELRMSRYELAEEMGMHYQSLSRCLNNESISEQLADMMGRALDAAPEWLAGNIPDDFPHSYAVHLYQVNTITPRELVDAALVSIGYNPQDIAKDKKKYWGVYDVIKEATSKYMDEK